MYLILYIYTYIYIHMAPTQEHPAKYFSAHICPRPCWNPVKFQPYFKNSHHRQPQQILIAVWPKTTASYRPGVGSSQPSRDPPCENNFFEIFPSD